MKKYSYLIIIILISGLVLTGCSLLSNISQVPATEQSGITYLTKGVPLPINLVGLWRFNGDANDSSDNGLNGTFSSSGASLVVDGFEQALNVDGTGWVQVPDSSLLEPSEITVEAWVKRLGSPGSAKYIVSKYLPDRHGSYSSYGLYTGSGGLRFYIGYATSWIGSPQAPALVVWDGDWHHVAGTFDGDQIKLYLDGVQVDGATSTIQDIYYYDGISDLFIGSYYNGSWLAFSGRIDEVRIWNTALTADQLILYESFSGLLAPYKEPPKAFKIGSSIPLKWQYTDSFGTPVDSSAANPSVEIKSVEEPNGEPIEGALIEVDDPGSSGLRYDSDTKTWHFNWQTKDCGEAGLYYIWIINDWTGQTFGPFRIQLR